jgi:hypothetical protein
MNLKNSIAYAGLIALAVSAIPARADMVDPPYAAKRCIASKQTTPGKLKACCAQELEGIKSDVAKCVKMGTAEIKNGSASATENQSSRMGNGNPQKNPDAQQPAAGTGAQDVKQGLDTVQSIRGLFGR